MVWTTLYANLAGRPRRMVPPKRYIPLAPKKITVSGVSVMDAAPPYTLSHIATSPSQIRKSGWGGRFTGFHQNTIGGGIADRELPEQMIPLVEELPPGGGDRWEALAGTDLRRVEATASSRRFTKDLGQVGPDRRQRLHVVPEADQLRVVTVVAGLPPEDGLRQQRLPPEGDQSRLSPGIADGVSRDA